MHERLLEGFCVNSRPDGTVHTIKRPAAPQPIGEVCVGKTGRTRLNFKQPGIGQPEIKLAGRRRLLEQIEYRGYVASRALGPDTRSARRQ
jgi:hypothetical protein